MAKRYTDEALSRVLSEHAAGNLERYGSVDVPWVRSCVNGIAFNEPCSTDGTTGVFALNPRVAAWFDRSYRPGMTPEELISGIEAAAGRR